MKIVSIRLLKYVISVGGQSFKGGSNMLDLSFVIIQIIVLVTIATIASAQLRGIVPVSNRDRDAVVLNHVYEPNPLDGSYVYKYD